MVAPVVPDTWLKMNVQLPLIERQYSARADIYISQPAPPPPADPTYTFKNGGITGAGQTTLLGTEFIAVHNTDSAGTVHNWASQLGPTSTVTWGAWTGAVGSVNTAIEGGTFTQEMIDTFVSTGITLMHPSSGYPVAPTDGSTLTFTVN
jgi:hypothetical protein